MKTKQATGKRLETVPRWVHFKCVYLRSPRNTYFCCNICGRVSPGGKITLKIYSGFLVRFVVPDQGEVASWFYVWYFSFIHEIHVCHIFFTLHPWVVERTVWTACKRDLCRRYDTWDPAHHRCCSYQSIFCLDAPFYYLHFQWYFSEWLEIRTHFKVVPYLVLKPTSGNFSPPGLTPPSFGIHRHAPSSASLCQTQKPVTNVHQGGHR